LCWKEGESWDGWLTAVREGRGGMGKKMEKLSVGRVGIYRLLPMESSTECVRRYTRRWVRWWMCHVTVQRSQFESLGHSVSKIVWKKIHVITPLQFSKKLYNLSVIRSVYTDRKYLSIYTDELTPSVYTDRIRDGIISIGKNYRRKNSVSNSVGNCTWLLFISIMHFFCHQCLCSLFKRHYRNCIGNFRKEVFFSRNSILISLKFPPWRSGMISLI
jgi:hypothetical protein